MSCITLSRSRAHGARLLALLLGMLLWFGALTPAVAQQKPNADLNQELQRQFELLQETSAQNKRRLKSAERAAKRSNASETVSPNLVASGQAQAAPAATNDASGAGAQSANGRDPHELNPTLKVGLLLLLLGLLPAILVSVTSFMRIVIVLGFVRQALGTQSLPPNQVIIGLSLFLCLFTMGPTMQKIDQVAVQPYLAGQLNDFETVKAAEQPIRDFMARHTRAEDLKLFVGLSQNTKPKTLADVSTWVLIPSFMLSELRTAFLMGALVYLPFVLVDLIVSTVLMSMGMMMVPPAMIAMPIKLLLFVLVDGWTLVVGSLARSIMAGG